MEVSLNGRVALITGGSLGLGRAMGRVFALAGAGVALVARRPKVLDEAVAEIAAAAPAATVRAYPADVRDADQLTGLFTAAVGDFGQIDILVNNAGTSQTGRFEEITDAVWQADLDLKLMAAVRLARLAMPGMRARHWGRIINVLNSGAKAPRAGGAPTAVTRAAGMALTKVLAGEGAADNILVNALCTGIFVTDQWHRRHESVAPTKSFEQFVTDTGRNVPLGRMGDAEEFANLACFLASDKASYITGTAINVDGGSSPAV